MTNILILGSRGFIGANLVKYFLNKGFAVTGCDLTEFSATNYIYYKVSILSTDFEKVFLNKKFAFCVNASGSGNVSFSRDYPMSDFEANTLCVAKVLDAIRKYQPQCKYLHISSAAVYGNPKQLPVKEDDELNPLSPYGFHKWMSEIICKEYQQLYKLPISIVRPFSVYGPGLRKQIFWDVFEKYKNGGKEIELSGTGYESRDFIYIDDLSICIDLVLQHAAMEAEVYNTASGTETTIADVVTTLFSFIDTSVSIIFNKETRQGDPLNWCADTSRICRLGFKPSVPTERGLEKTANWLKEQL